MSAPHQTARADLANRKVHVPRERVGLNVCAHLESRRDEGEPLHPSDRFAGSATHPNLVRLLRCVVFHTRNDYRCAYHPPAHRKANLQYIPQDPQRTSLSLVCPGGYLPERRDDLYFPVGQTSLALAESDAPRLGVVLEGCRCRIRPVARRHLFDAT